MGERFQQKSFRGRAKRSNINSGEAEKKKIERRKSTRGREGSGGRKLQEVLGQQEEAAPGRPTDRPTRDRPSKITLLRRPQSDPPPLLSPSLKPHLHTDGKYLNDFYHFGMGLILSERKSARTAYRQCIRKFHLTNEGLNRKWQHSTHLYWPSEKVERFSQNS